MTLFLDNQTQAQCIGSGDAIEAIEGGVRQLATGQAIRRPRIDNLIPGSEPGLFFSFSSMEGGLRDPGYYALRIKPDMISWPIVDGAMRRVTYCYEPGMYGGLVLLFSTKNAELLAILNDGFVQHERVAATGALGIRYMSNPQARVMCIIGSGGMARSFAAAGTTVRPIERIQAFSPNRSHLDDYCREMSAKLSCEVVATDSIEAAVADADIISACTNSYAGVIPPELIKPGVHITNVMPNELSPEAFAKIQVAGYLVNRTPMSHVDFVDDDFGFRVNVMSYAAGTKEERDSIPRGQVAGGPRYPNAEAVACCDWATGTPYKRERGDEITTLFNSSLGIPEGEGGASAGFQGLQFACVAGRIYERASSLGLGAELPLGMFLQDIPT